MKDLNIHWKDWCWSSNTLVTGCEELTLWKSPWCWERLRAGGEGGDRGWDGWMASLTQWTWVWANSRRQWRTGKPGVLQFMGLQSQTRLSDWTTMEYPFLPPSPLQSLGYFLRLTSTHPWSSALWRKFPLRARPTQWVSILPDCSHRKSSMQTALGPIYLHLSCVFSNLSSPQCSLPLDTSAS